MRLTRSDSVCMKDVQSLVEIVDLSQGADDYCRSKDVSRRLQQLVITTESQLQCDTKAFDGHD